MRIFLTGASGQLGTELRKILPEISEVVATDIAPPAKEDASFRTLDLGDADAVTSALDEIRPDVIINAAAYTQVDKAESDTGLAMRINAGAPGLLAGWAARNDALLVHYSTDYVFNGESKRAYAETDEPSPINAYGESKLAGERAVAQSGCRYLTLRTAWIYSAHGANFLRTMLRLARERSHLSVVNDQFGCPTWAANLARVSMVAISQHLNALAGPEPGAARTGLYHYCDSPACTWYDFASLIFEAATAQGMLESAPQVEAVTSDQFQTAARRPQFSVLDTRAIETDFRIEPASVRESVWACIRELNEGI